MKVYVAIAYRWGFTNCHNYLVGAGVDEQAVVDMAEKECQDRDGKYGVEVLGYEAPPQTSWDSETSVTYFPSARNELSPKKNWKVEAEERIGFAVRDGITLNKEIPNWLRERVESDEAIAKALCGEDGGEAK